MGISSLIVTGMALGVVHVLTGPDHLSALATLSVNTNSKQSFWYGVRWGIGHSIGLVVVGGIFIVLSARKGSDSEEDRIPIPEPMEFFAECLVGIFMIFLGSYHFYIALNHWSFERLLMDDVNVIHSDDAPISFDLENADDGTNTKDLIYNRIKHNTEELPSSDDTTVHHEHTNDHQHPSLSIDENVYLSDNNSSKKQILAIFIGLMHGVAGPGGVLGVIPAVQLHDVFLSVVYLGTFCCCSTITMGLYAASYGYLSSRISGLNLIKSFRTELFSASLSIIVGVLWLLLLAMGKLQDIFP